MAPPARVLLQQQAQPGYRATPVSVALCGDPVAVSVKDMVPRWVPTDRKRLKSTVTVHEAPGARLLSRQVSVPLVQDQINPAPATLSAVIATLDALAALLVTVTVPAPVKVPVGRVTVTGVTVNAPRVATPVPLSVTGEFVTVAPV